jgi:hypothetical protein
MTGQPSRYQASQQPALRGSRSSRSCPSSERFASAAVRASYARQVQVRETNFKRLVQGEKQLRAPWWQRQYTWRMPEHRLLWRDILEQYARAADGAAEGQSGCVILD